VSADCCVTDEGVRVHQQTPPRWQEDTVIDISPEIPHQQPVPVRGSNSRAIAVTCSQHGAVGFTNLMVSTHEGIIVLDPHVAGSCVQIILDETAAIALFDLMGEWLG
jgi:hypothetical protein